MGKNFSHSSWLNNPINANSATVPTDQDGELLQSGVPDSVRRVMVVFWVGFSIQDEATDAVHCHAVFMAVQVRPSPTRQHSLYPAGQHTLAVYATCVTFVGLVIVVRWVPRHHTGCRWLCTESVHGITWFLGKIPRHAWKAVSTFWGIWQQFHPNPLVKHWLNCLLMGTRRVEIENWSSLFDSLIRNLNRFECTCWLHFFPYFRFMQIIFRCSVHLTLLNLV